MSYTVTLPAKTRPDLHRWIKAYKAALVVVVGLAAVALIVLAQIANDRFTGDVNAPFTASGSQAF